MKITAPLAEFSKAFSVITMAVAKRSPSEILKNTKLATLHGGVYMEAKGPVASIRTRVCDATVTPEEDGEFLIPAERMEAVLKGAVGETISLEPHDCSIHVQCGKSKFNLQTSDVKLYPVLDLSMPSWSVDVENKLLSTAFKRTVMASDPTSSRYALGGVYLELEKQLLCAVATDGRMMAAHKAQVDGNHDLRTVNVPKDAATICARRLGDTDNKAVIALTDDALFIRAGGTVIKTSALEGRFPKWRDVLPNKKDMFVATTTAAAIHSAVVQASAVSSEETTGIHFCFKENLLILKASTSEIGSSEVELVVESSGEPQEIQINYRLVLSFLKTLQAEDVVDIHYKDSESAVLFGTRDGSCCVIMPLAKD